MFKTAAENEVLRKAKHKQLLKMYRNVLTKVSNLKLKNLDVSASADFGIAAFSFTLTVYVVDCTNKSLTIYDFWEIEKSAKLVDDFITAIRTDNFETVNESCLGV